MSALTAEAAGRPAGDPIFRLHAEAVRRERAGEPILNATLGALIHDDGRLAVLRSAADAFRSIPIESAAGYAPIRGVPAFLEAVRADVFHDPVLRDRSLAVATPGCTGALRIAVEDFLEPGQAALTSSYYWGSYRTIASHAGRRIDVFDMFRRDGRLDLDAFAEGVEGHIERQGRALILFNFPCHNPTGYSLDEEEWGAVAEVLRGAGRRAPVAFLLDHAYAAFGKESSGRWVRHVPTMLESCTVLVGWTMSKSFALYGARVGALVAAHRDAGERERLACALAYSCRATWSNCNHLGMRAAAALLGDPGLRARSGEERAELMELLQTRVSTFNRLAAGAGLDHPRYEGGFFVSVFTPDGERTAAAMREEGVYVLPMAGAVRIALCATPESSLPRLVDALAGGVAAAGDPRVETATP